MLLLSLSNIRIQPFILMVLVCHTLVFSEENIPIKNTTAEFHIESDVKEASLLLQVLEDTRNNNEGVFHFFSHGRSGELLINGEWLNASGIVNFLNSEFNIQNSTVSNLNIYGCEFAKGENGKQAVAYLENELGLKINASTNITGKDGDWLLEVGNKNLSELERYSSNLQCVNQGTASNQDYDCDGVMNSNDLDDDNDGILDTDELTIVCSTNKIVVDAVDNSTKTAIFKDNGQEVSIKYIPQNSGTNFTGNLRGIGTTTLYHQMGVSGPEMALGFEYTNEGPEAASHEIIFYPRTLPQFGLHTNTPEFKLVYDETVFEAVLSDPGNYITPINNGDIVQSGVVYNSSMPVTSGNPFFITLKTKSFVPVGFTSFFEWNQYYPASINAEGPGISMKQCVLIGDSDIDGDGLINSLDLDTDGDGCPDAFEGGGNYRSANLVASAINGGSTNVQLNLGTSVDTNGVPNTDANATTDNSQTIGDSQAFSETTECCKEAKNYPSIKDTDGDGYGDACDLDDDNDGILDTDEQSCESFDLKGDCPVNITPNQFGINRHCTGWRADGNNNFDFMSMNPAGYPRFDLQGSIAPTMGKMHKDIEVAAGNSYTYSIERQSFFADYCPGSSPLYQAIDTSSNTVLASVSAIGTGDLDITFLAISSSVRITLGYDVNCNNSSNNQFFLDKGLFNNGTNSAMSCTDMDTDNDGIPNHLDLDSDGDGCPDALEGGANFTNSDLESSNIDGGNTGTGSAPVSTNLGNNVGATDTTMGIPAKAGTGQSIGLSQDGTILVIEEGPEDITECSNTISNTIEFTAMAVSSPSSATISYEWQVSTDDGANFSSTIPGASGATSGSTTSGVELILSLTGVDSSYSGNIYKIIYTTPNNSCPVESEATLLLSTPPPADAGADQTIDCNNSEAHLGVKAELGYTYLWSPAEGLSDTEASNPTARPDFTTAYTLTVTETATGCSASDEVIVTISSNSVTAEAGADQTIGCAISEVELGEEVKAGYTYLWSPAEGLSSATVANPIATPETTTTYILTLTETATGCRASDEVIVTVINNQPTAEAGTDQTIDCSTTSALLGEEEEEYTYLWTPAEGLSSATVANPTATPNTTTTYTLTVTDEATGCSALDQVTVTVSSTLSPPNAGADQTIDCSTTSALLGEEGEEKYTYLWTPAEGLSSATVAMPTATPEMTTTYTLTVTDVATGCSASDQVTVTVSNDVPDAEAGADQTIDCSTTSALLGEEGEEYTYLWTPAEGLSDATVAMPTATPEMTTTYTLTVTDETTGCSASDQVTVTVSSALPSVNAGTDQTIDCSTTSALLGEEGDSKYTYLWSPAEGLTEATVAMPTATPETTTTYTLTVTDEATGCSASDQVTVTVSSALPSANAGTDQTIDCSTAEALLGEEGEEKYTYLWSPAEGLSSATIANPKATPETTETYTLTVTDKITGCSASNQVTVTVSNDVPPANAGADQTIDCSISEVSIGVAGDSKYTYLWSPAEGLSDATVANPIASPNVTTTYELSVTDAQTACVTTDLVTITIAKTHETQSKSISLCVNDDEVDLEELFETPTFSSAKFFDTERRWVIEDTEEEITNIFNPNDFEEGTYVVLNKIFEGGCSLERRVSIRVHRECVYVPCISDENAISVSSLVTPDGDMVNDKFAIDIPINSDSTDGCDIGVHLKIYNRWGALIYEDMNYQNDWTGAAARDAVGDQERTPRSTYYYIIELTNSGIAPIQGYFLLGTPN